MSLESIKQQLDEKIGGYFNSFESIVNKTDVKSTDVEYLKGKIDEYRSEITLMINTLVPLKVSRDGSIRALLYSHVESQFSKFESLLNKFGSITQTTPLKTSIKK